jgi:hypothetical protein
MRWRPPPGVSYNWVQTFWEEAIMVRPKPIPQPQRVRRVPRQFSWIDQRLVRGDFLTRCDPPAAALYLFLVTVADAQGLSYYGETALCRHLQMTPEQLHHARERLIGADLVAFQAPIYQVLALPELTRASTLAPTPPPERIEARRHLHQLLEQLRGRHD